MDNLKLLIIGFGAMGKIHHKAIMKNNLCSNPYVVDSNPDSIKGYEKINYFKNLDEIINDKIAEIDGVIVSTPSLMHLEHSINFIENDIPLLIEKPLTSNEKDDKKILDMCIKRNSILRCGLIELYNPVIEELANNKFNDIKFVHIKRHSPKASSDRLLENVLLDLLLHDISILFKIFKPQKIVCEGKNITYEGSMAESVQVLLKVDDKYSVFLSSSRQDQEKIRTMEILDEDSSYFCDLKNKYYEIKKMGKIDSINNSSITESNILKKVDMLDKPETAELQLESFIQNIENKKTDLEHIEIVRQSHKLVYQLLSS